MTKINYAKSKLEFPNYIHNPVFNGEKYLFGISEYIDNLSDNGITPSSIGLDLLVISSLVYGSDNSINRDKYSDDGWSRIIELVIPVKNIDIWNKNKELIGKMLKFLTGDLWSISFVFEENEYILNPNLLNLTDIDFISLFSGGMDSLIGAIDQISQENNLLLVSHSRDKIASSAQTSCHNEIERKLGKVIKNIKSYIGIPENTFELVGERTERSRSFLFFSIAACIASGMSKDTNILVPENAVISLNIPLDNLRMGAHSTRTTHPYLLSLYNCLLENIGIRSKLINPYKFKTKGEMVRECRDTELLYTCLPKTMSCSSASKIRWRKMAPKHCGFCIPCIIRKAALFNQKSLDPTDYYLKFDNNEILDSTKMSGGNVRSFQLSTLKRTKNLSEAKILIRTSGPMPFPDNEINGYAEVYLRGLNEVNNILKDVKTHPIYPERK